MNTPSPASPSGLSGVGEYIEALKNSRRFGSRVIGHRQFAPLPARYGSPPDPVVGHLLAKLAINHLYTHQQAGIDHIRNRRDTLIATPTASGKSLIYNLPVLAACLENPAARSLYLFPLKALARDQLAGLIRAGQRLPELTAGKTPLAAIYDGDTSSHQRRKIRTTPSRIVITNPDMLHLGLLPFHDRWSHFFAHLTHVVIDEVHTYRGIFGAHMAWVLRRLQRVCHLYGADPVFVCSSATIGNPRELGTMLLNRPVQVVDESGAPKGRRHFILINPLESAGYSAALLLEAAIRRQLRTIIYTRSRKMTELITMWARRRLPASCERIASYRAGFLPQDRQHIEQKLYSGALLGVISTSALELGIDIGALDICILVGYPGSMLATWQRAGRVGRGQRESLVMMLGQEDALDQHFMRHPATFFQQPLEPVVLDATNPVITRQHLVCSAAEIPIQQEEFSREPAIGVQLERCVKEATLLQAADGMTWFASRSYPQHRVNLRGSGSRFRITIQGSRQLLGEIDAVRALKECHPGAIYLHMASSYRVDCLDLQDQTISVSPITPPYYTQPLAEKHTEIIAILDTTTVGSCRLFYGRLRVTEQITGYLKRLIGTKKIIEHNALDLPPQVFTTTGFWLEIPDNLRQLCQQRQLHFMGGIHALEHGIIGLMPLVVLCDRNDLGGISCPGHPQLPGSGVFLYDGYPGGIGLCRRGFVQASKLLAQTRQVIRECGCEHGCPGCVHSPKCGSGNRPIDKQACLAILDRLLTDHPRVRNARITKNRPALPESGIQPADKKQPGPPAPLPPYLVFDLETQRSAQEVGGWHRAERMGMAVGIIYDSRKDCFETYSEEKATALIDRLAAAELVIGFNNKRFDNKVLSAYTRQDLDQLPALDILEEIFILLGYRLSLDRLAKQTLGIEKNGTGLQALQWFRQGRMDKLIHYCTQDVRLTRDLFRYGWQHGYLLFRNKAGDKVRLPVDFAGAVSKLRHSPTR